MLLGAGELLFRAEGFVALWVWDRALVGRVLGGRWGGMGEEDYGPAS